MEWESLLSLKRFGDKNKRLRIEQDDLRLGFEVDYDRIVFSNAFRSLCHNNWRFFSSISFDFSSP